MTTPSRSSQSKWQTDWTKCCLCQQDKKEELKSPPSSYKPEQDGYSNIAANVPLFQAINALPIILDPARLDEEEGIDQTLRKNEARYHQSCHLMFNNSKQQRAQKRTSSVTEVDSPNPRKMPRRNLIPSECFLYEKSREASELRHAMTQQLNDRVNECALTLSDGKLLAKLSGGDAVMQELKYHPACLVALYNRQRAYLKAISQEQSDQIHTAKKCIHWPFQS